jgi:hypothetical protein
MCPRHIFTLLPKQVSRRAISKFEKLFDSYLPPSDDKHLIPPLLLGPIAAGTQDILVSMSSKSTGSKMSPLDGINSIDIGG